MDMNSKEMWEFENILHDLNDLREEILRQLRWDYEDMDENDLGNAQNMPERAQCAFNELIEGMKAHIQIHARYFNSFEAAFYGIIRQSYQYQRNRAENKELINIAAAKPYLYEEQYQYLKKVYEIFQGQFQYWLKYRDNYHFEGPAPQEKIDQISAEIEELPSGWMRDYFENKKQEMLSLHLIHEINRKGDREHWQHVKSMAAEAHALCDYGELANRIMLISDLMLIRGIEAPENENLVKYLSIRKDFIKNCCDDSFGYELGISPLPYIDYTDPSDTMNDRDDFDEIMLFPATIEKEENQLGEYYTLIAQNTLLQIHQDDLLTAAGQWKQALDDAKQNLADTHGNEEQTDQIISTLQTRITLPSSISKPSIHGTAMLVDYESYKHVIKYTENDPDILDLYCQAVFTEYAISKVPLFLPDYSACATMYGKLLETCLKKRLLPIFKTDCPQHQITKAITIRTMNEKFFTIGNACKIIEEHFLADSRDPIQRNITNLEQETWRRIKAILDDCGAIRNPSSHSGEVMTFEKVHQLLKKSAEIIKETHDLCQMLDAH